MTDCPRVLKQLSLDAFVEYVAIPSGKRSFAVMEGDQFLGLVALEQIQQVPRNRWKTTRVADVMIPPERLLTARLDEDLMQVVQEMGRARLNQLPVLENGEFIGIVTRESIFAFLRAHTQKPVMET